MTRSSAVQRCLLQAVRDELLRRYGALDLWFGFIWGRNAVDQRMPERQYPN